MNVKYLIAGPGRTGSLFVTRIISASTRLPIIVDQTPGKKFLQHPVIYHTHHATLQLPDNDDLTVVCVTRKNLSASIISSVIAENTGEWSQYTGTKAPFVATKDTVEAKYIWNKWWQSQFDKLTTYKNKVYLEFEEFTKDSTCIFKELNLPIVNVPVIKSPYTSAQILNIDEVYGWIAEFDADEKLEDFAIHTSQWNNLKSNDN